MLQRAPFCVVVVRTRGDRADVCSPRHFPVVAVRAGDVSGVERLTSSPRFSPAQPIAATMLVEAVWCREPARMVRLLLSKGVAVTGVDSLGCAVLHSACARGDVTVVRALLDAGAAVNRQCAGGSTALHHAAAFGNADVIR